MTTTTTTTTPSLRDALLAALGRLGGTRTFHLHVLVTTARKHADLYPYATPRPRAYLQDVLILLSEEREGGPRKLVAGVEAHVYTIACTQSAILYISKVDSTGQASAPSPTFCLAQTLIGFYADPRTRPALPAEVQQVWVHVFARAQGQYLFPNSAEFEGKRPLSDVRLCGWWKRVFEGVDAGLEAGTRRKLYYILPGYGETEAEQALSGSSGTEWMYGHPYGETEIVLPCPVGETENLGHYIPSFEDDPKGRFMDELGCSSPRRKRGELGKVDADEFWERMSFRQECVAGAVTGFFALGISGAGTLRCGEAGQVGPQVVQRVVALLTRHVEFGTEEGTVRGTAVVEGGIRGLCGDVGGVVTVAPTLATTVNETPTLTPTPAVTVLTARRKR